MNQLDKLFKDKLEGFQKTAPSASWDRIQGQLDKKNNKPFFWLKIAASVLLFAVVSSIIVLNRKPELVSQNDVQVKKSERQFEKKTSEATPSESNEVASSENNLDPKKETVIKKKVSPSGEKKKTVKPAQKKIIEQMRPLDATNIPEQTVARLTPSQTPTSELPNQNATIDKDTETVVASVSEEKEKSSANGVTLVYTAEEVNEKYLDKKSLAKATSEEKKQSTLKKLLDKAYDLKHNQDPIGDLRQKKNEILALNFKSDKQRSQNR